METSKIEYFEKAMLKISSYYSKEEKMQRIDQIINQVKSDD